MTNSATTEDRREFVRGLAERYGPDLRRLAFQISRNEADATDLVQETMLRALKLGTSRALDDPRAWLFRILRNVHADRRRRERRRAAVSADDVLFALADPQSPEPGEDLMFAETVATGLEHVRCGVWCLVLQP